MTGSTSASERTEVEALIGASGPQKYRQRFWLSLGLAAFSIAAVALTYIYYQGSEGANATQYQTMAVTRGGLQVTATATGTVEPTNEVEISSELSGIIKEVKVDFNDLVKSGQILAELDTDKLKARVAHSRALLAAKYAKVRELEATLVEKQKEFERVMPLARKGFSSQANLDVAKAALHRALATVASGKADVAVAKADLNLDETNLKKACICSPIDGVVLKRNVDPGQTVASSFQAPILFTLAEDLREMQLEVDVDEADIGKVKEGNKATFTVESYQNREFPAVISELRFAPETVEGVVTYKAILSINNSELLLRPGMTATAEITVQTVENALLIPNAALRYAPAETGTQSERRGILRYVLPRPPRPKKVAKLKQTKGDERRIWVLREGESALVNVRIGATDGSHTQVLDNGLAPGDRIITDVVAKAR